MKIDSSLRKSSSSFFRAAWAESNVDAASAPPAAALAAPVVGRVSFATAVEVRGLALAAALAARSAPTRASPSSVDFPNSIRYRVEGK
jgi:hypothetical protein